MKEKSGREYCRGCVHFRGHTSFDRCCNYIFDTQHRRPCPPGEGCTVKIERKYKLGLDFLPDLSYHQDYTKHR